MIQDAGDLLRRIEPAAVGIHVENDRGRARALGFLLRAAEKEDERRRHFAPERDDDDVALAHDLARLDRA